MEVNVEKVNNDRRDTAVIGMDKIEDDVGITLNHQPK